MPPSTIDHESSIFFFKHAPLRMIQVASALKKTSRFCFALSSLFVHISDKFQKNFEIIVETFRMFYSVFTANKRFFSLRKLQIETTFCLSLYIQRNLKKLLSIEIFAIHEKPRVGPCGCPRVQSSKQFECRTLYPQFFS